LLDVNLPGTDGISFPKELKSCQAMEECMNELTLVSPSGFRSAHDDFGDTISMLSALTPWKPSEEQSPTEKEDSLWGFDEDGLDESALSSYVV